MPGSRNNRNKSGDRRHRHSRTQEERNEGYESMLLSLSRVPSSAIYGACFVFMIFGLSFLIVGAVHVGECNLEKMIPVWLLIMGIFLMLASVWLALQGNKQKNSPFRKLSVLENAVTGIMFVFFFIWFIIGNVWIYKSWADDPDFGHYWFENACNKSLFILSFCTIITFDVVVGVMALSACCWLMSRCVVKE